MEEFKEIIAALKKQEKIETPDYLTRRVMERVVQTNETDVCNNRRSIFHQLFENEVESFNRITSYSQCAILLLAVGLFYLVAGVAALWKLYDTIISGKILEHVLTIPWAWGYIVISTMPAVVLGVLLIGALRSAQKVQTDLKEENYGRTF